MQHLHSRTTLKYFFINNKDINESQIKMGKYQSTYLKKKIIYDKVEMYDDVN